MEGNGYKGNSRIAWSPVEVIELTFDTGANLTIAKDVWLKANLTTPFDGWHINYANGGFFFHENTLKFNTTIVWAEIQNFAAEFYGDYELTDSKLLLEMRAGLNSTIRDVPTISAYLKHSQNESRIFTDAEFKKLPFNETLQVYLVRSSWRFDNDRIYKNVTGSLAIRSPYEGYQSGALVTKFSMNHNKELLGAADFELEGLKYTVLVDGHIKKITDNMLIVNITTPFEKFRKMTGRFGINERDKHAVAVIRSPNITLGAEALFAISSSIDFDIKFSVETPLEAFQKLMLIAKKKPKIADFRGAFNEFLLGFTGIWRFHNVKDFEYSYRAFIPLRHFEENGVVARFVNTESFDLEMTAKLAQYKVGLLLLGEPKPKLISDLGMQTTFKVYSDLFRDELPKIERTFDPNYDYLYSDEEEFEEIDKPDKSKSYTGYMELDILVWPTIKGDLRFDDADLTYLAEGHLELPQGVIEFKDRLYFPVRFTCFNKMFLIINNFFIF